jgi:hypothetical protein
MLDDLKSKILALRSMDFENEFEKTVEDNAKILIGVQQGQWAQGHDRDDNLTTLDGNQGYAMSTYKNKQRQSGLSAITSWITGYDTGALYENTSMTISNKEVTFKSSVDYWGELTERTGPNWPGIDAENRKQFALKYVVPRIRDFFASKMGFK